jgi:phosphosulfolactate synthase
VLAKVVKKAGRDGAAQLVDEAAACFTAGADVVCIDAADVRSGATPEKALQRLVERCGIDRLVFELPGRWAPGATLGEVAAAARWLLERFGSEVNVGNVPPDLLPTLGAMRYGLTADAAASR